jgi:hypothetical protein
VQCSYLRSSLCKLIVRGGGNVYFYLTREQEDSRHVCFSNQMGFAEGIPMHRIAKMTRAQLETLIFVAFLALLHVISSVYNVPAGVYRDRSSMASSQVTIVGPARGQHQMSASLVKF